MVGEDVYEELHSALLSNRIPPGSALRIDDLSRELGVSSTPIREALSRLAVDGLVTKRAYHGWTASDLLDSGAIADLYDARRLIEPELTRRAAERATATDHDYLKRLLAAPTVSGMDQTARIDAWIASDERLHGAIATLGGNPVTTEFLERVNVRMRTYRAFYGRAEAAQRAHAEHKKIVAAILVGKADAAALAMAAHLQSASERLVHAFE
jgi:DNA-binding GntR family transcriptional regulator